MVPNAYIDIPISAAKDKSRQKDKDEVIINVVG
jgi:hypothetical protein